MSKEAELGADENWRFHFRDNGGLEVESVTIKKGPFIVRYKKDLWGIYKNPNHYELRLLFKRGKGMGTFQYGEVIKLDEDTQVSIKLSRTPSYSPREKLTVKR